MKNVTVYTGNISDLNIHFNELCRSKYLMVAPSSFSLWAAFISKGKVFIDNKCEKFRPNLFKDSINIPNFIMFDKISDLSVLALHK